MIAGFENVHVTSSLDRQSDAGLVLRRAVHDALDGAAGAGAVVAPDEPLPLPGFILWGQRGSVPPQEGQGKQGGNFEWHAKLDITVTTFTLLS